MKAIHKFIVEPLDCNRYDNEVVVSGKKLIINTSIEDHKFVNRIGVVKSVPLFNNNKIKVGDKVVVHHNIFRRFYDIRGEEKDSGAYFKENEYFVYPDQIFLYNHKDKWISNDDYCFVKSIKKNQIVFISDDKEENLIGILKYTNSFLESIGLTEGDKVGFSPNSEYEFLIEGEKLYRVTIKSITIKYE